MASWRRQDVKSTQNHPGALSFVSVHSSHALAASFDGPGATTSQQQHYVAPRPNPPRFGRGNPPRARRCPTCAADRLYRWPVEPAWRHMYLGVGTTRARDHLYYGPVEPVLGTTCIKGLSNLSHPTSGTFAKDHVQGTTHLDQCGRRGKSGGYQHRLLICKKGC